MQTKWILAPLLLVASLDDRIHQAILRTFPRLVPRVDAFLEAFLAFVGHPLLAVLLALVGGVLVNAEVISLSNAIYVFGAWCVGVAWFSRTKSIKKLSVPLRLFVTSALALLLGFGAESLARWSTESWKSHRENKNVPTTSVAPAPRYGTPFLPFDLAKQHLNYDPDQLTLHDLYLLDFPSAEAQLGGGYTLRSSNTHVEWLIVWNIENGSQLIKLYIPYTEETVQICQRFAVQEKDYVSYRNALAEANQWEVKNRDNVSSNAIPFSKRIFVYHEYYISAQEIASLDAAYKSEGLILVLRDAKYVDTKQLEAKLKLAKK